MTQQSVNRPSDRPCETAATAVERHATARDVLARHVLERTIGTPEHAALVEALRHDFPEIFDPTP